MKTIRALLTEYGFHKMARDLGGIDASTVLRWARNNRVPRWWRDQVCEILGAKRFIQDER